MENISPKMQNQLAMLQQLQQQLQTVAAQKTQVPDGHPRVPEGRGGAEGCPRGCRDLCECRHGDGAAEEAEGGRLPHREGGDPGVRVKSLEKQEKAMQARFEQLSTEFKGSLDRKKPTVPTAE